MQLPRTICAYKDHGEFMTTLPIARSNCYDAQVEGTKTCDEVCDVCCADSCTNRTQFLLRGRAVMHSNFSVDCECDVSYDYSYMRLLIATFFFLSDTKTIHLASLLGPNSLTEVTRGFYSNE